MLDLPNANKNLGKCMLNFKNLISYLFGDKSITENKAPTVSETNKNDIPASSSAVMLEQLKPVTNFLAGLPQNIFFATATTPPERLALERITFALNNPTLKPPSYLATIQKLKLEGLFAGTSARTTYCLTGNFFTLLGISFFGNDAKGLLLTSALKNALYPVFLWSNGKQRNFTREQITKLVLGGMKDPAGHASFFSRNLLANFCLLPGFMVSDFTYQYLGESDTKLPKTLGLATSLGFSALMNAFFKSLFTDPALYPLLLRWNTAKGLPGLEALAFREIASLFLIFSNTALKKSQPVPESFPEEPMLEPKNRPR